ncbi:hypothetical protein B0H16DRAFT_365318 [Mycena metata]|uniref:Uncharacterized protein n=1 Tax=Mycena metata TaxID=1033252 RepID=A0AAD7HK21_9AGAR|nr:hypothetical protein B0H16DRAFT_365318 [Mycena metata]
MSTNFAASFLAVLTLMSYSAAASVVGRLTAARERTPQNDNPGSLLDCAPRMSSINPQEALYRKPEDCVQKDSQKGTIHPQETVHRGPVHLGVLVFHGKAYRLGPEETTQFVEPKPGVDISVNQSLASWNAQENLPNPGGGGFRETIRTISSKSSE